MIGPLIMIAVGLALAYASYLHYNSRLVPRKRGTHNTGPGMTRAASNERVAANIHYIRTGERPNDLEHYWS